MKKTLHISARIDEDQTANFQQAVEQIGVQFNADIMFSFSENYLNSCLSELFADLGIPARLKGHEYLKTAIALALENPTYLNRNISSKLYPEVAAIFDTTAISVERAIRQAISVMCNRGNYDKLIKIFGSSIYSESGKPTNSEFIARIVDFLELQIFASQANELSK